MIMKPECVAAYRADPALPRGKADVAALEWGSKDCQNIVAALAEKQYDYVVATDCTYIDPDGNTPDDNSFMTACAELCHKQTTCLITFEDRGSALRKSFLAAAHTKFTSVKEVARVLLPLEYQLDHIDLWELRL